MQLYLGVHKPHWLGLAGVPLMLSRRRLVERRLPRALAPWVIDSSAFTELGLHGRFMTPARQYAAEVRGFMADAGMVEWAAIQDWMCEPTMLARTGLDVLTHQRRTVRSYLELRELAPEVRWLPTVQGWTPDDYLRCVDLYAAVGVDLAAAPLVGLGSVCRRQSTAGIVEIVGGLRAIGLRVLHGFGVKILGLALLGDWLASIDTLAWSYSARRAGRPLCGQSGHHHKACQNCLRYALAWRERLLSRAATSSRQLRLEIAV